MALGMINAVALTFGWLVGFGGAGPEGSNFGPRLPTSRQSVAGKPSAWHLVGAVEPSSYV